MTRHEKIEEMLKQSPDDTFLNYALAMEHRSAADMPAAIAGFQRVRGLDPNYVPAYFQEAQVLAGLDRLHEARQILQQGIAVAQQVGDEHARGEMQALLDTLE